MKRSTTLSLPEAYHDYGGFDRAPDCAIHPPGSRAGPVHHSPSTAHCRPKHHLRSRVKINALESLVQTTQQAPPVVEAPPPPAPTSAQPGTKSPTDIPAKWEKTEGQRSSVREEWATERERLSSTSEEWKLKAKTT
ncbi:hypothetical protein FIBSPDRAFT_301275 [Athelia psychrophila]|uniref:Uncharacterized protein n=1 Tax=Athelia psychrophila TaxID=1759441 RepID=A0A167X6L6_9AGAM|nr:hypothetical protein FIBSPDRAFT_301275 [Fibularhizoctonia sp. CBS 109695]